MRTAERRGVLASEGNARQVIVVGIGIAIGIEPVVMALPADAERERADRLLRHVEALASGIGPRPMGRPGSLEAAAYVRHQLGACQR